MEEPAPLRAVRSNPSLASILIAQREFSASTPPVLNNESRLPLPEECHIPLPLSPTISSYESERTVHSNEESIQDEPQLPLPLFELLHAIQEDKYESRRLVVLQDEAHGLFHKCGSCDRFLTVQAQLYRRMVDCFRNDKKTAFASLYSKAMSYPSFGELHLGNSLLDDGLEEPQEVSWLESLPSESRRGLLDFLYRLRSDPSYVANCISRLSPSQLKRLVRTHRPPDPTPVFRNQNSQGRYDGQNVSRLMAKPNDPDALLEDLLADPLSLMVHGVFDLTPSERSKQIDIWSSVCAKLVEDGKPGADEFCLTVMNLFVEVADWQGTPQLELFLSDLVSAGVPFLEAGGHNIKFTHPQHKLKDTNNTRTSSFLDGYLSRLLDLISTDVAPPLILNLLRSILGKIQDPNRRTTARNFFFLRWYCASFLTNVIVYPENHAIMMDHHINNSIRQKLLHELALRVQSTVADVLSPWSTKVVPLPLIERVHNIMAIFEEPFLSSSQDHNFGSSRSFLFLRAEDVLAITKALMAGPATESSATSLFGQGTSSSSSTLTNFHPFLPSLGGVPHYEPAASNPTMQSQTWHGPRPVINSAYSTLDRNTLRPESSDGLQMDPEKDLSFPFLQDLWMLTVNRDYQASTSSNHGVAVIFIRESGAALSLDPFRNTPEISVSNHMAFNVNDTQRDLLTEAVDRLSHEHESCQIPNGSSLTSIAGLREVIESMLTKANAQFDFQGQHFWWQCLQVIRTVKRRDLVSFLTRMAEQRQNKVLLKRGLAQEYDDWLHALRSRSTSQDQANQKLSLQSKRLRNKMWFVSDVRHSSAYEDAHNVVRALRAMIEPTEPRQSGVTAWAKQRFRSSFGQERVLAQILELMTAPKTYGGPNKLSESQVEITAGWLLHENIENFCRGEERVHRFCYEIQKCVKRLAGEALLDSPVLWSSPLYANEKSEHGISGHSASRSSQDRSSWRTDFSYPQWTGQGTLPGQPPFSNPEVTVPASSPNAMRTTFDHSIQSQFQIPGQSMQGSRIPPQLRTWILPPSPISPGVVKTSTDGSILRRRSFLQNIRTHLTSLLLSDLGASLWNQGSETDWWINDMDRSRPSSSGSISGTLNGSTSHEQANIHASTNLGITLHEHFDFQTAYQVLLKRFRLSTNPQSKLQHLYELFLLAKRSYDAQIDDTSAESPSQKKQKSHKQPKGDLGIGVGVPRTRLTRLQEVAANCEDRRVSSMSNARTGAVYHRQDQVPFAMHSDDLSTITTMQDIFENPEFRPQSFYRDLQYIAAFTSSAELDCTPQGTAFWTIGLAAMRIKAEKSKSMTDNAMQILDYHYGNGNKKEPVRAPQSSPGQTFESSAKLSQQDLSGTTLQDAARLLTISALEGDPTAARELALFYLTHPELVSRVTLPLSRPSDVFRAKHGITSDRGNRNTNDENGILDSVTFAVVFHWMEFAANAGDADAITFFKENKDLGKAL